MLLYLDWIFDRHRAAERQDRAAAAREVGKHLLHITAVGAWLHFSSTLLMFGIIKQSTQTRAICVQGHTLPLHLLNHSLSSLKAPSWVGYICPKRGRCSLHLSNSKGYHSPSTILKVPSRFSSFFSRGCVGGRVCGREVFELKLHVAIFQM